MGSPASWFLACWGKRRSLPTSEAFESGFLSKRAKGRTPTRVKGVVGGIKGLQAPCSPLHEKAFEIGFTDRHAPYGCAR